jgi:hypothetical protein
VCRAPRSRFDRLAGSWSAPALGRIELRRERGEAVLDAGEWSVRVGKRTERDGTAVLVSISAPVPGLELTPRGDALFLDAGGTMVRFTRAAK